MNVEKSPIMGASQTYNHLSSFLQIFLLFGCWLSDKLKIYTLDIITKNVIRKYIYDLMARGKYTIYSNDLSKKKNCPERQKAYHRVSSQPLLFPRHTYLYKPAKPGCPDWTAWFLLLSALGTAIGSYDLQYFPPLSAYLP